MRRNHHRCIPIPTIRFFAFGRLGPNRFALVGRAINPGHASVLRFSIEDARVGRIHLRLKPVSAADNKPFIVADAACRTHAAWPAPGIVVLQTAAHRKRRLHIVSDVIKLTERHILKPHIRFALIVRDAHAAISADHHVIRVRGIDPRRMKVNVDLLCTVIAKSLAAIV